MSAADRVRAYARAFYDAAFDRWLGALDEVAGRLEQNPAVLARIESTADLQQRQRLLDGLLPQDVDPPVRNFLYTLLQRGDLASLSEVSSALRQIMAQAGEAALEIEVTSAVDLTPEQQQTLRARLESRFGTNIDVRYRKDPTILGGMIVRAGDKLIDGSVATRLQEMRQTLGVASRQ